MKIFCLILSLTLFISIKGQDIGRKLENKIWFVTGDLLKPEKCNLYSEKTSPKSYEMKLLKDRKISIPYEDNEFKLTCGYDLKSDMIKIHYIVNIPKEKRQEKVAYYYKIRELNTNKVFGLTPINASDFK